MAGSRPGAEGGGERSGLVRQVDNGGPTPQAWRTPQDSAPSERPGPRVGILAVQGDFLEHAIILRRLGVAASEVRLPRDLANVDALIIPGGESTTIARMLDLYGLREPIKERTLAGMPLWGTCAGLILLARELREDRPAPLGLMDIRVARNAYGRQTESFETDVDAPSLGPEPFRAVFIRAPAILEVGPGVQVLARLDDGSPIAASEGSMLVTAFHPELTPDTRFHEFYLSFVEHALEAKA